MVFMVYPLDGPCNGVMVYPLDGPRNVYGISIVRAT